MLSQHHKTTLTKTHKLFYRPRAPHSRKRPQQQTQRLSEHTLFVRRAVKLLGCYECGERHTECLSFYVPVGSKRWKAIRIKHCKTLAEVKQELRSGEVLCRNCHRVLTNKQADQLSWLTAYKRQQGCRECGISEPQVLDFHHVGRKRFDISQHRYSVPTTVFLHEVNNAVVLCANCHSKQH